MASQNDTKIIHAIMFTNSTILLTKVEYGMDKTVEGWGRAGEDGGGWTVEIRTWTFHCEMTSS